jgi:hypothetical protein
MNFVNSAQPFGYASSIPETLTVVVSDADSNFAAPRVVVHPTGLPDSIVLLGAGTALRNANPAAPCSVGVRYFNDTAVSVILKLDSVVVQGRSASGAFDISCYSCFWQHPIYRNACAWQNNSGTASIKVGTSVLNINRYATTVATTHLPALSQQLSAVVARSAAGVHLELSEALAAACAEIRLYSLNGQFLALLKPARNLTLPKTAAGMLYVQFVLNDGRALIKTIPLTR